MHAATPKEKHPTQNLPKHFLKKVVPSWKSNRSKAASSRGRESCWPPTSSPGLWCWTSRCSSPGIDGWNKKCNTANLVKNWEDVKNTLNSMQRPCWYINYYKLFKKKKKKKKNLQKQTKESSVLIFISPSGSSSGMPELLKFLWLLICCKVFNKARRASSLSGSWTGILLKS